MALENQIKTKLGIKYSAAKQLIEEAKANLEITDDADERADEIIDEATQIFEDDLQPADQGEMRVSGHVESDFKKRAQLAAERREAKLREAERQAEIEAAGEYEEVIEDDEELVEEMVEEEVTDEPEEIIEEVVEEMPEDENGGKTTITETTTTHVGDDGTQTIVTKTIKKKTTIENEENGGGQKVVCFCAIL
jgi:hypothetical protein